MFGPVADGPEATLCVVASSLIPLSTHLICFLRFRPLNLESLSMLKQILNFSDIDNDPNRLLEPSFLDFSISISG